MDIRSGVTLSLLLSHISQFTITDIAAMWATISREVSTFNPNSGTLTLETISQEIREAFAQRSRQETIPEEFVRAQEAESPVTQAEALQGDQADAIMFASLLGAWNEKVEGDCDAIKELIEGND